MSDDLGDTSLDSTGASQSSDSEATDPSQDTGDTGSGSDVDEGPVPYERFKESRDQLSASKTRIDELEQNFGKLQSQYQETAQWNQWAWQEMQSSKSQPAAQEETDPYADPLERRVKELEGRITNQQQFHDHRYQEMQVKQAEREIMTEISSAKAKYPEMRDNDVVNSLVQNPNASVMALAKRSHEAEVQAFNQRLKRQGYKAPPKSLQRGRGKMPVKKDFGDDLGAAEEAALQYFGEE